MRVQKRHFGKEKAKCLQFFGKLLILDVSEGKGNVNACGSQGWDPFSE